MDALAFLKSRTVFIRFFYDEGARGFVEMKHQIDNALPPFDNPPYSEDGEPAFLVEWLDADTGLEVLGLACISMLSDTLKLYFNTLASRVIGFSFQNKKQKGGFVPAYFEALGEILDTDWSDCPADRALIEQIVLARNRGQHGEDLTSFTVTHDKATIAKHPRPFFIDETEMSAATTETGSLASFLMPTIKISAAALETAMSEVEMLAEWIDGRLDRAHEWRLRQKATKNVSSAEPPRAADQSD